jgi:4-amino-4-deoxy-L-arabinose transferase-like glycosyltransferase
MPNELRIALLAAGIIAIVAALLLGRFRTPAVVRVVVALAGVGLLLWAATPWLIRPEPPPVPPPAPSAPPVASSAAAPATVDLTQSINAAILACPPTTEPAMPDGARASREQMVEATSAFKAYDTATVAYTHCVDAAVERLAGQYAGVASAADIQNLKAFGISAHNTAVDQEQALADRLNEQVRIYKGKHRG